MFNQFLHSPRNWLAISKQNFCRVKLPGISGPKPGEALVAVATLVQVGDLVLDGGVRVALGAEPDADPEGDGWLPDVG